MALYFEEEAQWELAMRLAYLQAEAGSSLVDGLWVGAGGAGGAEDADDLLGDACEGMIDDLDSEVLGVLWGRMVDSDEAGRAPARAGKPAYGSDLEWLAGSDGCEQPYEHTAPYVLSHIAARQRPEDFAAAEASEASTLGSSSSSCASSPSSNPDPDSGCVPGLYGYHSKDSKKSGGTSGRDRIKRRAVSKDFEHLAIGGDQQKCVKRAH